MAIARDIELPTKNDKYMVEEIIDTHNADNPELDYSTVARRPGGRDKSCFEFRVSNKVSVKSSRLNAAVVTLR